MAWIYDDKYVIEALSKGVVKTPLSKFNLKDTNKYLVVRIKSEYVDSRKMTRALSAAYTYIGDKYEFTRIFKLALYWMLKWRHSDPVLDEHHKEICSEVIAAPLHHYANFHFRDDIPYQNTTPKDIYLSNKAEGVV